MSDTLVLEAPHNQTQHPVPRTFGARDLVQGGLPIPVGGAVVPIGLRRGQGRHGSMTVEGAELGSRVGDAQPKALGKTSQPPLCGRLRMEVVPVVVCSACVVWLCGNGRVRVDKRARQGHRLSSAFVCLLPSRFDALTFTFTPQPRPTTATERHSHLTQLDLHCLRP